MKCHRHVVRLVGALVAYSSLNELPQGGQYAMAEKSDAARAGVNAARARDPNIAVAEEYEAATAKGTIEALELFIARHPGHPLAEKAHADLQRLQGSQHLQR